MCLDTLLDRFSRRTKIVGLICSGLILCFLIFGTAFGIRNRHSTIVNPYDPGSSSLKADCLSSGSQISHASSCTTNSSTNTNTKPPAAPKPGGPAKPLGKPSTPSTAGTGGARLDNPVAGAAGVAAYEGTAEQVRLPPASANDPCQTFPALPAPKPIASNTGVPVGTSLTASGSITASTANMVIDGKDVTGTIDVFANNVTIKNTRLKSNGYYGIRINGSVSGTRVLHSEIFAPAPSGNYIGINADGTNSFICGNYLHGFENAMTITGSSSIIQANFIEKLFYITSPPPHYDGIEVYGGNNQKLWGNNILMTDNAGNWLSDTGAINPTAYGGSNIDNVEINGNWFGGGSNTLNLGQQDTSILSNVKVTNNHWYRSPAGICRCNDPPPSVWSGNVWDDTGATIPL